MAKWVHDSQIDSKLQSSWEGRRHPTDGGDVLPTIRAEFHRLAPGTRTAPCQEVGSAVWQVFDGSGRVDVGGSSWDLERGDLFVVPSWAAVSLEGDDGLDLFRFSDSPIIEKLGLTARPVTDVL